MWERSVHPEAEPAAREAVRDLQGGARERQQREPQAGAALLPLTLYNSKFKNQSRFSRPAKSFFCEEAVR